MSEDHQDVVTVFGDSHSRFFFPTRFYAGRLGLKGPLPYRVEGHAIAAASVAGFRPVASKLKVREEIQAALPEVERLVLAFGQVDLELGYYYRLAVKGEQITPQGYVEWLGDIYQDFMAALDIGGKTVALKGVNLTALAPRAFSVRYVSRIVTEGSKLTATEGDRLVAPFILGEDEQNDMHLAFNRRLAAIARAGGHRYFDLVQQTRDDNITGLSATPTRLAEQYRTGFFDHHLADTVPVRRMHFESLGRVFELI